MHPIQPAQRVERPPQPAAAPFNIDSPEDEETDTSTESSFIMSEQFITLPWPSPATPPSGRASPIPMPRGMSQASSAQPTHTPESSLTAWSGAYVMHNFGHNNPAANNNNNNNTNANGSVFVGASWTSASRDMATFELLRANSGRGGGSGRQQRRTSNPQNAALTEANIDFLRQVPLGVNASSGRKGTRGAAQNSARPPRPHHGSAAAGRPAAANHNTNASGGGSGESPPRGQVRAAVAAFNKRWGTDSQEAQRREKFSVSPVRLSDCGEAVLGVTTAEEESLSNLDAHRGKTSTPLSIDAVRMQPSVSSSAEGGGGGAQVTSSGHHHNDQVSDAVKTSKEAAKSPGDEVDPVTATVGRTAQTKISPTQRRPPVPPPPELMNVAAQPSSLLSSPTSSPSAAAKASRSPGASMDSRPRRTASRHQAQVLPEDVTAADLPELVAASAAPTLPPQHTQQQQKALSALPCPTTANERAPLPSADAHANAASSVTPASSAPTATDAKSSSSNTHSSAKGQPTVRRRTTAAGRKPTTAAVSSPQTTTTTTAATVAANASPATAAGGNTAAASPAGNSQEKKPSSRPAPAKRLTATTTAPKNVPAAPSQYISGGRLVQASRRMPIGSPTDAELTKTPAPATVATTSSGTSSTKAAAMKSPLTPELGRQLPGGMKSPTPPPPPAAGAVSRPVDVRSNTASTAVSSTNTSHDPFTASTNTNNNNTNSINPFDTEASNMGSLVSCSVHTIPPEKARQLRVRQSTRPLMATPHESPAAPAPAALAGPAAALDVNAGASAQHPRDTAESPHSDGDAAEDEDAVTPLLTVEVTRLSAAGPPTKTVAPASRSGKPTPPVSPTPAEPVSIPQPHQQEQQQQQQQQQQPTTPSASPQGKDVEKGRRPPPPRSSDRSRSASPKFGEDSLTGPPTPTQASRRATATNAVGSSGSTHNAAYGQARRSTTGSRSSNNTSREWNVYASGECPMSVESTQPPLSARMAGSGLQWTQHTNGRSSSADTSERGERDMSFTSTLSVSADNSVVDPAASSANNNNNSANPTINGANTSNTNNVNTATTTAAAAAVNPASRHKHKLPQPPFSLEGHSTVPRRESTSTATLANHSSTTNPSSTTMEGEATSTNSGPRSGGTSPAAAAATSTSPSVAPLVISPPTSTPPNKALRARRATVAVNGSVERLNLAERRASAPAPAERRSAPGKIMEKTNVAHVSAGPQRGRTRGGGAGAVAGAVTRSTDRTTFSTETPLVVAAPSIITVGGRQLPRMFPSADDVPANGASTRSGASTLTGNLNPTTTEKNRNSEEPRALQTDDAAAQALANRRRAYSLPAGAFTHGEPSSAQTPNVAPRVTPEVGRGFTVNKSAERERRPRREHPQRPESHLQGSAAPLSPEPALRGGNAHAGPMLPPALNGTASGNAEASENAFQPARLQLPALTRFPRTPLVATVPDTPPFALQGGGGARLASTTTDDVRQESSGSGASHANSKDSNAMSATTGFRRRPSSVNRPQEEGTTLPPTCDSNTSSLNNRTDATQSDGSMNGETPENGHAARLSRKAPQTRQRAPSVFFFE